jgi:chaperone required for assembly of F1-ATPase
MKRFYTHAAAGPLADGQAVLLDGRPVRTPGRQILLLPTAALAAAVAAEWDSQVDTVQPATMPLTQLASTALDRVGPDRAAVAGEIARYAATDLVCYCADEPADLVQRQHATWAPLLEWLERAHGARLVATAGIQPIPQAAAALAAIQTTVAARPAWPLTALSSATAATGSVVIALALADGRIAADDAAAAALVDETFQAERWGIDPIAAARRDRLRADLAAAERFLALLA